MKKILQLTVLAAMLSTQVSGATGIKESNEDTVVIEFGQSSKILIVTETAKDMKALADFDINQMISDLNSSLDSVDDNRQDVVLEYESGDQFLKEDEQNQLRYYGDDGSENNYKHDSYDFDFDFDFFPSDDSDKRTRNEFEIELGVSNWLDNGTFPDANGELYTIKPLGSWYLSFNQNNITDVAGPLKLNWGMGVSLYTWKMDNENVRIVKGSEETIFFEDVSVDAIRSKLSATFVNAKVVPMFHFGEKEGNGTKNRFSRAGFRIGAGGYVGYKIDSRSKFVYKESGDKQKDKSRDNFFMNSFRYGVRAQVGFRSMDMFFNYDLNDVFATGKGPSVNGISFGVIL